MATRTDNRVALEGDQRLRRARHRWTAVLIVALLFGAVVYLLAVQTGTGQRLEDAAVRGASQVDAGVRQAALDQFHTITVTSQLAAAGIVGLIGLVRRQVWLAIAGIGVILGGQALIQVLKYRVLSRPELVAINGTFADNTLPSGHTTAAMSLLFATLIVMPYRFRGVAMFFTLTWAVGMGAYTVIINAHRLSDTLAADAVALIVACAASHFLARTGRIRSVVSPSAARYTLRAVFVVLVGAVGAASLALGLAQVLNAASSLDFSRSRFGSDGAGAGRLVGLIVPGGCDKSAGVARWAGFPGRRDFRVGWMVDGVVTGMRRGVVASIR